MAATCWRSITLAGLDSADQVLLVLAPEIASVRAAACALNVFEKLDYPTERMTLLLNTTVEQGGLARKDIEMTLHRPTDHAGPALRGRALCERAQPWRPSRP
ncbi:MAG: hypothetical protein WCI67_05135 [Chloroflexales bacterium]